MKKGIDIIRLVESYGIDVVKKGSNYFCNCVFHRDNNPSLCLFKETASFFCFSCNVGGPIEKLIAKIENISTKEAYKKLYGENYEFNALSCSIEDITPDAKFMLDRLAKRIKSRIRQDKDFMQQVPALITNITQTEMNLLKFNSLIKKIGGQDGSTKNV